MKKGRKSENPEKSLTTCFRNGPENSSPNRDSNLYSSIGGKLGKQTRESLHHASPHDSAWLIKDRTDAIIVTVLTSRTEDWGFKILLSHTSNFKRVGPYGISTLPGAGHVVDAKTGWPGVGVLRVDEFDL